MPPQNYSLKPRPNLPDARRRPDHTWLVIAAIFIGVVLVCLGWAGYAHAQSDPRLHPDTARAERDQLRDDVTALQQQLAELLENQQSDPEGDSGGSGGPSSSPPDDGSPSGDEGSPRLVDESFGLGMNLGNPNYWSSQWTWADAMKQAKDWDANGQSVVFWDINGQYPGGRYTLEWDGTGTVEMTRLGGRVVERGANRVIVEIPSRAERFAAGNRRGIRISRDTSRGDVSNVRLWMPGCSPAEGYTSVFHPVFLERMRPFGVLRFMDWQRTNHSGVRAWRDRRTPAAQFWFQGGGAGAGDGKDGVPLEIMIELCNELEADPWFCMPHQANDDFVRRFAEMVKDRLHPDAEIYLEYSNEWWNTAFAQNGWLGDRDPQGRAAREAGRQAQRDYAIWAEVFGDDAGRVIRVAAGQRANLWQLEQFIDTLGAANLDVISCAAYHGAGRSRDIPADITALGLIELSRRTLFGDLVNGRQGHADLAAALEVPFIAYEAGQHITPHGKTVPWYSAFVQAQSHPEMFDLYLENLASFEAMGGSLFVAFNSCRVIDKNGAWGHLEFMDQPIDDAPKYRALVEYLESDVRLQTVGGDN